MVTGRRQTVSDSILISLLITDLVLDDELEGLAQAGGAQLWSSTALPSGSVT